MTSTVRALMDAEGLSYSGAYKRLHPAKAREYARRDNAKRTQAKQDAWRGVCGECGGQTSRRDVTRCAACARVPSDVGDKIYGSTQIGPSGAPTPPGRGPEPSGGPEHG